MKRIITKSIIIAAVLMAVLSFSKIHKLKEENARLLNNQEILLTQEKITMAKSQAYKASDSLNAAKVSELQFTLKEYKKYKAEDLQLIEQLKVKKSDLQKVVASQSETIFALTSQLKDSIRNNEITGVLDTIKCFDYHSKWTDIAGCISADTIDLQIANRESLKIVETVKYKRFLGFLWKTNKVKSRHIDIVSENPYTKIVSVEAINIER